MAQVKDGDDPAVVTRTIVTATTDKKPKSRCTAGLPASRVTAARRLVPAGTFDKQICKKQRRRPPGLPVRPQGRRFRPSASDADDTTGSSGLPECPLISNSLICRGESCSSNAGKRPGAVHRAHGVL
ncbi:hypothetical protein OG223_08915 [Streptomyces sp. NBC_01478]|uniref:hypothetical protein n=1 Tax=Streptomyces sp. NBC_01478 TaxID=2903882 RepID=UPI002E300167|nr:hypothetical protein [Streptomyces sp. NBC_01478]